MSFNNSQLPAVIYHFIHKLQLAFISCGSNVFWDTPSECLKTVTVLQHRKAVC